jgi:O-antigen/teichoic acid export membrane protein
LFQNIHKVAAGPAGTRGKRHVTATPQPTDSNAAKPFADRVKSAVFWRSGSQILAQIITWGTTLAVVRLLDPADYGLFAMTQVVLTFLNFLNGYGFASALIQSESLDTNRVRQAFGLLILLNAALAIVQLVLAPYAASYYQQPLIADLLRVQALIFLATPFIALPEVMMSRDLAFRKQALVNLAAAAIGAATALGCALNDLGVWTLVYAAVAVFWSRAIGLTIAARLLVWPSFNFRGCGPILMFGGAMLASHFLWLIQTQADILIAGRRFDPHDLGLYAEALFLTQIFVSKFVPPLNEVAFPAYARIQSDPAAVRWSFLKALRLIMLVSAPLYLGMAATSAPLVTTVFGPKWADMAPLVAILALAMPFGTMHVLFAPATNAMGSPFTAVRVSLFGAILFPVAFLVGVDHGAIGLAWAWAAASPALLVAAILLSRPVLGIGIADVARAALPALLPAIVMAIAVITIDRTATHMLAAPLRLALLVAAGAAVYVGLLWLLERQAIAEVIALIRRKPVAAPNQPAI